MQPLTRAACLAAAVIAAYGSVLLQDRPASAPASRPALPASVDLRVELASLGVKPRAQGSRPTCSVFTTAGAVEAALARLEPAAVPVSVDYLQWGAIQARGGGGDGGFFHDILAGFAQHGACGEQLMPYAPAFDAARQPAEAAIADARGRVAAISGRIVVHWIRRWAKDAGLDAGTFAEVQSALARGWPVAAGSHHSRLLVGYRDAADRPGGGVFLTQDSALGGYGEVSYEFVRSQVFDAFWVEALDPPGAARAADTRPAVPASGK